MECQGRRGRTTACTRAEGRSTEATYSSNNARYTFVTAKRTFEKYGEGAISTHKFVRRVKSAWSEAPCLWNTKSNKTVDNITDRIRQLLRLYAPIDDSPWNAYSILRLEEGKSTQEIVANFYNMQQGAPESTDTFSLRLHKS